VVIERFKSEVKKDIVIQFLSIHQSRHQHVSHLSELFYIVEIVIVVYLSTNRGLVFSASPIVQHQFHSFVIGCYGVPRGIAVFVWLSDVWRKVTTGEPVIFGSNSE